MNTNTSTNTQDTEPEDGGARAAERESNSGSGASGLSLADFAKGRFTDDAAVVRVKPGTGVEPADAGLLRALATDVEQDGEYAFGPVTAGRLRALADWIETERPVSAVVVSGMLRQISDAIGDGAAVIEIQAVFEEPAPGTLSAADLPTLLDALRQADESAIGDD